MAVGQSAYLPSRLILSFPLNPSKYGACKAFSFQKHPALNHEIRDKVGEQVGEWKLSWRIYGKANRKGYRGDQNTGQI